MFFIGGLTKKQNYSWQRKHFFYLVIIDFFVVFNSLSPILIEARSIIKLSLTGIDFSKMNGDLGLIEGGLPKTPYINDVASAIFSLSTIGPDALFRMVLEKP